MSLSDRDLLYRTFIQKSPVNRIKSTLLSRNFNPNRAEQKALCGTAIISLLQLNELRLSNLIFWTAGRALETDSYAQQCALTRCTLFTTRRSGAFVLYFFFLVQTHTAAGCIMYSMQTVDLCVPRGEKSILSTRRHPLSLEGSFRRKFVLLDVCCGEKTGDLYG